MGLINHQCSSINSSDNYSNLYTYTLYNLLNQIQSQSILYNELMYHE